MGPEGKRAREEEGNELRETTGEGGGAVVGGAARREFGVETSCLDCPGAFHLPRGLRGHPGILAAVRGILQRRDTHRAGGTMAAKSNAVTAVAAAI